MLTKENNSLLYRNDMDIVEICAWGTDSLRVRAGRTRISKDRDFALLPVSGTEAEAQIEIRPVPMRPMDGILRMYDKRHSSEEGVIINGNIKAVISDNGQIGFYRTTGETLLEENLLTFASEEPSCQNRPARELKSRAGNSFRASVRFKANDGEKIYGMGQQQFSYLDLKGSSLELSQRSSKLSVPFYFSSLMYGFLWNNPAIGRAIFGFNETEWTSESTQQIDYWITVGDSPSQIMEHYGKATGMAPMMPSYGMGYWQAKLRYCTQEEVLSIVEKYREKQVPMDTIFIDFFHWKEEGDWSFDPRYFPDPKAMSDAAEKMRTQICASIWPTVSRSCEKYNMYLEKGFFVQTERGVRATANVIGETLIADMSNPEFQAYLKEQVTGSYIKNGVKIFCLDTAEPDFTVFDYDNYRYYMGAALETSNMYCWHYAKCFYEMLREAGVEQPMNLIRCGWAGSQRFGAIVWSGDVESTFASLKKQIIAGLSMAMAGIPWWTSDVGGIINTYTDAPEFGELLIRWFQFGCFSPVFRNHGCRLPEIMKVEAGMPTGMDNEIWSFGEENEKIMTRYILLREQLRPYIAEQMRKASEHGTPVIRPLFFDFPEDISCWEYGESYMFGPDILVAPVTEFQARSREVYLPACGAWKNVWTDEITEGGTTITVDAPLDRIPLFVRENSYVDIRL